MPLITDGYTDYSTSGPSQSSLDKSVLIFYQILTNKADEAFKTSEMTDALNYLTHYD